VDEGTLDPHHRAEFQTFEGNAQTFRVVTRLQVVQDDLGLNLTYGTLAALMKYTVGSSHVNKSGAAPRRKLGYFASEKNIVTSVWDKTGLSEGVRHPLAYIIEACDDIAYLVLDAKDAVKKQIVSFADLLAWLASKIKLSGDSVAKYVIQSAKDDYERNRETPGLSPSELNDVGMQKFRVHAIHAMMSTLISEFERKYDGIMKGDFNCNLLEVSPAENLARVLRDFDKEHAYRNRQVLEVELAGFTIINRLMDFLWYGITDRTSFTDVSNPDRKNPFASYAYGRISENYRRIFERRLSPLRRDDPELPIRYRELQLLTDMISGTTDGFAVKLADELGRLKGDVRLEQ
jgi:dGTPase